MNVLETKEAAVMKVLEILEMKAAEATEKVVN